MFIGVNECNRLVYANHPWFLIDNVYTYARLSTKNNLLFPAV